MATSDDLAELLQTLPQELFDKIYDNVFTADGGERLVDWDYKPPVQLQVDRGSRDKFAESYNGGETAFILPHGIDCGWLQSLPTAHFLTIAHLKCPRWEDKADQAQQAKKCANSCDPWATSTFYCHRASGADRWFCKSITSITSPYQDGDCTLGSDRTGVQFSRRQPYSIRIITGNGSSIQYECRNAQWTGMCLSQGGGRQRLRAAAFTMTDRGMKKAGTIEALMISSELFRVVDAPLFLGFAVTNAGHIE